MNITYGELSRWRITRQNVSDLNHLLPQLSKSAKPLTMWWIIKMLWSGTRVFAAFDNKQIVGVVLLVPTYILVGRKDWIEDVVVSDDYRRLGIGDRLMDEAEAASRLGNPKHINLTSSKERGVARDWYLRRGYKVRLESDLFRKVFFKS
jgi:ribosomal protein S18 acetylase RimI-like enzyme